MICRREEEPLVYEIKFYDSLLTFDNDHVTYIAECGYVNGLNAATVFEGSIEFIVNPLTEPLVSLPTVSVDHCYKNHDVYMNLWKVSTRQRK